MEGCTTGVLVDVTDKIFPETPPKKSNMPQKSTPVLGEINTNIIKNDDSNTINKLNGCSSSSTKKDVTVDDLLCQDIKLLDLEEFDFDWPVSPSGSDKENEQAENSTENYDDEDEIFFGEVGFKEQCKAAARGIQDNNGYKPLSPLSTEQMVQLFAEAQTVACRIAIATKEKDTPTKMTLKALGMDAKSIKRNYVNETSYKAPCVSDTDKENCVLSGKNDKVVSNGNDKPVDSPLRRQGTFRVTNSPLATNMLPVVRQTTGRKSLLTGSAISNTKKRSPSKTSPRKRLGLPIYRSKLQAVKSKIKTRFSPPKNNQFLNGLEACRINSDSSDTVLKRTLPQPKLTRASGNLPPGSKLHKRTESGSSNSSICSNVSQSSAISNASQTSTSKTLLGFKAPTAKLNLIKTGDLQRKPALSGISKPSTKPIPLKATVPLPKSKIVEKSNSSCKLSGSSVGSCTPVKANNPAIPKRIITGSNDRTPEKGSTSSIGSVSSCAFSTPRSVQKSRRSLLPTPSRRKSSINNSRLGSFNSPSSIRTGSTSSMKSTFSDCNSPVFGGKIGTPRATQNKKPLVQHTPAIATTSVRKHTGWTPIRKPKLCFEDEVLRCTKKTYK